MHIERVRAASRARACVRMHASGTSSAIEAGFDGLGYGAGGADFAGARVFHGFIEIGPDPTSLRAVLIFVAWVRHRQVARPMLCT